MPDRPSPVFLEEAKGRRAASDAFHSRVASASRARFHALVEAGLMTPDGRATTPPEDVAPNDEEAALLHQLLWE